VGLGQPLPSLPSLPCCPGCRGTPLLPALQEPYPVEPAEGHVDGEGEEVADHLLEGLHQLLLAVGAGLAGLEAQQDPHGDAEHEALHLGVHQQAGPGSAQPPRQAGAHLLLDDGHVVLQGVPGEGPHDHLPGGGRGGGGRRRGQRLSRRAGAAAPAPRPPPGPYLFAVLVLGAVEVGEAARAQDGAHRGRPLHGDQPVLAQQDVPHVLGAHHPHRGPPEEVSLVDEAVFPALHLQEFPPLDGGSGRIQEVLKRRRGRCREGGSAPPGRGDRAKPRLTPPPSPAAGGGAGRLSAPRRTASPHLQHHL